VNIWKCGKASACLRADFSQLALAAMYFLKSHACIHSREERARMRDHDEPFCLWTSFV
jgi:hypothetical protein